MRSMTGFGRSVVATSYGTLITEIKTVNHRYCQLSVRLPPEFADLEPRVSALVKGWAARGQLTINVERLVDSLSASPKVRLNVPLAEAFVSELRALRQRLGFEEPVTLTHLLTLSDLVRVEEPEWGDEERLEIVEKGLREAWSRVLQMRDAEGGALQTEMRARLDAIRSLCDRIVTSIPDLVEHYRERLRKRIQDLTRNGFEIDEARIAMEAGILGDRADVTEELARLTSHLDQFEAYLVSEEAVGRQMDFLLQEMNREANTIASKAPQAEVVSLCVTLKMEIERLREQAQNVE